MNQERIGKFIEKLRKEKGYTQKELGDILGVSNGAVSKWECGNNLPDISILKPLSEALDIDMMNLLSCREPSDEERTNRHKNRIKSKCFETIKYLTWILVLVLIIILCSFPVVLKAVREKPIEKNDNEVQVYEIISNNKEYAINGYVIFNNDENIVNINKLSYSGEERGTKKEIYTENIKLYFEIGGETIYSFVTDYEDGKKRKVSDIINEIKINNDNSKANHYKIYELKDRFSDARLRIECYEDNNLTEEFSTELILQQKFN